MKILKLPFGMTDEEQKLQRISMLKENIRRGKLFAKVIIVLELLLAASDVVTALSKVHDQFHFTFYFFMYMTMVFLNTSFLIFANVFQQRAEKAVENIRRYEMVFLGYIILFMLWGTVIALSDQHLYGQLMAFVINIASASVIFYFTNKQLWVPYSIASITLFVGLPFFQPSTDILTGHYINLTIFLFFLWIASRIQYMTYCSDFHSKILLKQSNEKLEEANVELHRITLVDELTGIPNRRAFFQFVNRVMEQTHQGAWTSLMMIDIDFFKGFNDYYGHAEGDRIIETIGQLLNGMVRNESDFAARIGGEEFVFISFGTDKEGIAQLAESIRIAVETLEIPHAASSASRYVTISLGTATEFVEEPEDIDALMRVADNALYSAKAYGRNCVRS